MKAIAPTTIAVMQQLGTVWFRQERQVARAVALLKELADSRDPRAIAAALPFVWPATADSPSIRITSLKSFLRAVSQGSQKFHTPSPLVQPAAESAIHQLLSRLAPQDVPAFDEYIRGYEGRFYLPDTKTIWLQPP